MFTETGFDDAIPIPVHHAPVAATDAVCTLAADPTQYWMIRWILWSYDAAPTGGAIVISYGGVEVIRWHITASGPGEMRPEELINYSTAAGSKFGHVLNQAVEVRLLSGGGAVVGRLSVIFK